MSYWTKRRKIQKNVATIFDEIAEANSFVLEDNSFPLNMNCNNSKFDATPESYEPFGTSIFSLNSVFHDCVNSSDEIWKTNDEKSVSSESISSIDKSNDINVLVNNLTSWATRHKITHAALGDLLIVLRKSFPGLPKSPKTILKTEQLEVEVFENSYSYLGIKNGLLSERTECFTDKTVTIQVNIDGLPLFKSSSMQIWPILGLVEKFDGILQCNKKPFVIALYCNNCKPKNITAFLSDFVLEVNELYKNGITINSQNYSFRISAIICDTPARAFVKCTKGHNAYHGCDKCEQRGVFNGRVTFPETAATLRTDASFANLSDHKHHICVSPLAQTSIGLIICICHAWVLCANLCIC